MIRDYLIILLAILFYLNKFFNSYLSLFIVNTNNTNNEHILLYNNKIFIKNAQYDLDFNLCFEYSLHDEQDYTTSYHVWNKTLILSYNYCYSCDPEIYARGIYSYKSYYEDINGPPYNIYADDPASPIVVDYLIERFKI